MCLAYLLSCFLAHRPRPATRGNAGSASNEGFRSAFYLGLRPVAAFHGGKLQQSSSVAMQSVRSVGKSAKPLLSIGAVAFTVRRCRSQRFHRFDNDTRLWLWHNCIVVSWQVEPLTYRGSFSFQGHTGTRAHGHTGNPRARGHRTQRNSGNMTE